MGLFDFIGNVLGGPFSTDSGSTGPALPDNNPGMIAMANASKEMGIVQSNNQVLMAQTQAATMQLGILQNSQQAQFQTLAWLTERLDANDTKLQIAVENAKLQFAEQSDRHIEAMEGLKNDARELDIRAAEMNRGEEVVTSNFAA